MKRTSFIPAAVAFFVAMLLAMSTQAIAGLSIVVPLTATFQDVGIGNSGSLKANQFAITCGEECAGPVISIGIDEEAFKLVPEHAKEVTVQVGDKSVSVNAQTCFPNSYSKTYSVNASTLSQADLARITGVAITKDDGSRIEVTLVGADKAAEVYIKEVAALAWPAGKKRP